MQNKRHERYKCEHCGANLDPGEHCECQLIKNEAIEEIMSMLSSDGDGQLIFGDAFANVESHKKNGGFVIEYKKNKNKEPLWDYGI